MNCNANTNVPNRPSYRNFPIFSSLCCSSLDSSTIWWEQKVVQYSHHLTRLILLYDLVPFAHQALEVPLTYSEDVFLASAAKYQLLYKRYFIRFLHQLGLFGTLKLALALQFIVMNAYFSVARTLTLRSLHVV